MVDRRGLIAAAAGWAGLAPGLGRSADARGDAGGARTLRVAFPAAESSLDPAQTNSSLYSTMVLAQILEAPLTYDYVARPVRLVPATAVALPEVTDEGRRFIIRLRPGIYFADDPAFKGRRRELVAEDYVYAIKRFFDPRWKSSDLYTLENAKLPGMAALRARALAGEPFDYDSPAEGLRALDRYTFVVQLGQSDPRFVYNFAQPGVLGAVAREVVEFYGDAIGEHPVGTGAFRLGAWRRASRIELLRSPNWRGERYEPCLLYTSPSPRDRTRSRMPSSA